MAMRLLSLAIIQSSCCVVSGQAARATQHPALMPLETLAPAILALRCSVRFLLHLPVSLFKHSVVVLSSSPMLVVNCFYYLFAVAASRVILWSNLAMVPQHTQSLNLHLVEFFPSHEPREADSHYHLFNEARKKLKASGRWACWVCGQTEEQLGEPLELHHTVVEYALQNGIDIEKFKHKFPEFNVTTDEEFFAFVEGSEANLTVLCRDHHRGLHGVHSLPMPVWRALAVWRDDLPSPAQVIRGDKDD